MSLELIVKEFASNLCIKRGFKTPYEIILKPELPMAKDKESIVIVKAGNPPVICLSKVFIMACLSVESSQMNLPKIRDVIERSLEILPKMHHTLSLVPRHKALALRKESRRWARIAVPALRTELPDKYFKIDYAVTVTDIITGTSVTRNGTSISDLIHQAKQDVSRIVIEDEDMEDWREMVSEHNRVKEIEVKPNEVIIATDGIETITKLEY